ncbi:MAG: hypothetical protein DMF96_19370 [Acidobacteria bacterium]|nr:MAG: hypothetical protein DMF96_19370 [Acidobacteriota bacterium]
MAQGATGAGGPDGHPSRAGGAGPRAAGRSPFAGRREPLRPRRGRVRGQCPCAPRPRRARARERTRLDWTIAPSARGRGIFIEAARLVGSFAFGPIGARRLEARVLLQNGRASGALRKLGAVQEGVLRRSVRRDGEYFDQVLWSILKEDWGEHWVPTAPRVH